MYNFSVIIPHKNRQQMLQRCLDSIPRRDDVQIIVVDDKSDPKQVDFSTFPGLNNKHVEVYFTKKGKGAGYARNVGLKHAKGKWLIFADSDDWYLDNLSEMMDKYVNSDSDMIVFRLTYTNEKKQKRNPRYYNKLVNRAISTKNYETIRYNYPMVYGRFIKRALVEQNNITFQEVKYSNDVMFSIKVGYYAKNLQVIDKFIYSVFESENSLMRNNYNWKNYYVRTNVNLAVYKDVKKMFNVEFDCEYWFSLLWKKNKIIAIFLLPKMCYILGINRTIAVLRNISSKK